MLTQRNWENVLDGLKWLFHQNVLKIKAPLDP